MPVYEYSNVHKSDCPSEFVSTLAFTQPTTELTSIDFPLL